MHDAFPVRRPGYSRIQGLTWLWRAQALTHGTLPWAASHERRALFYRYVTAVRGPHGGTEIPWGAGEREAFVAGAG
jgi:hypothetical protein